MYFPLSKLTWRPLGLLLLGGLAAGMLIAADDAAANSARDVFRQGLTAYQQQNYKLALTLLRKMQADFPRSPYAVRGYEYIAQCENKLGDPYAAFEAYQKIWDDHKDFAKLPAVTRNQMMIANYYLGAKQYEKAIEIYRKVLDNAPHSDVAPAAQYSLAQAHLGDKDYDAAKAELEKLVKNYPTSQLVDDAAFQVGYVEYMQSADAAYDQQPTANAIAAFRRFVSNFPSSPKVLEAQRYIRELRGRRAESLLKQAEFYENIRATKSADIVYREVIEQYPDTSYADQARAKLKLLDLRAPAADTARTQTLQSDATAARALDAPPARRVAPPATPSPAQKQASTARIAQLKQDPTTRAQLRDEMKRAYSEELKRTRATREAMQKNRLTMLERSRQKADALLATAPSTTSAATPAPAAQRAASAPPTDNETLDTAFEPPRTADATGDTAVTPTPAPAAPALSAPLTEPVMTPSPAVATAASVSEPAAASRPAAPPVDGLALSDNATSVETEPAATPGMGATDAEKLLEGMGVNSDSSVAAAPAATSDQSDQSEQAAAPAAPAPAATQLAMAGGPPAPADESVAPAPPPQAEAVDQERVAEQTRAADIRQRIEAARQDMDEGRATMRRLDIDGRVRRAKLDDVAQTTVTNTIYNTDALTREFAGIYYLFKRGDALMEQGLASEAKQYYSDALDRLLVLKEKAPDWQADIVDYRIDHCRKQLRAIP